MTKEIGIGLVGTGFARTAAQIPAFRACKSARLVAICSGHYENAVKARKGIRNPMLGVQSTGGTGTRLTLW
jgi:predicted dehydrogenase